MGGIEEEKMEFCIDVKITNAIIDEILTEIQSMQGKQVGSYNFFYL